MTAEAEAALVALKWKVWRELHRIQDEFLAKMDWLARSTGQRMRVDRTSRNTWRFADKADVNQSMINECAALGVGYLVFRATNKYERLGNN